MHSILADQIHGMSVHQIGLHTPLFIDFDPAALHEDKMTWKVPNAWAPVAPAAKTIAQVYRPIHLDSMEHHVFTNEGESDCAFRRWSMHVESAIDRSFQIENANPLRYPISH